METRAYAIAGGVSASVWNGRWRDDEQTGSLGRPRRRADRDEQGHPRHAAERDRDDRRHRVTKPARAPRRRPRGSASPKPTDRIEALIDDPDIDAIYNPLPNHLHVPWTIRAAEAGKHVLCEKPIGLNAGEAAALIAVRDRTGVKIQEAFMVRTHPQWLKAIEICRSGELGDAAVVPGLFSFYNDDPANVRHVPEFGGGALMDIGCYLVLTSRLLFGEEPRRVIALMTHDPAFEVDTTTSMILDYPSGQAVGTCSMRAVPYQRVQMFGTRRRLEIEIPFNAPPDRACRFWIDDGRDLFGGGRQEMSRRTSAINTCAGRRVLARDSRRHGRAVSARVVAAEHADHRRAGEVGGALGSVGTICEHRGKHLDRLCGGDHA